MGCIIRSSDWMDGRVRFLCHDGLWREGKDGVPLVYGTGEGCPLIYLTTATAARAVTRRGLMAVFNEIEIVPLEKLEV